MDGGTTDAASQGIRMLANGGDAARQSNKAVWELKAAVGADGVHINTRVTESVDVLKGISKKSNKSGRNSPSDYNISSKQFGKK